MPPKKGFIDNKKMKNIKEEDINICCNCDINIYPDEFSLNCKCHGNDKLFCKRCLMNVCLAHTSKPLDWYCNGTQEYNSLSINTIYQLDIFDKELDDICNGCNKIIVFSEENGYRCICCSVEQDDSIVYCNECFFEKKIKHNNEQQQKIIEGTIQKKKKKKVSPLLVQRSQSLNTVLTFIEKSDGNDEFICLENIYNNNVPDKVLIVNEVIS